MQQIRLFALATLFALSPLAHAQFSIGTVSFGLCGDGVVTGFEACDDHNTNDFDGCSHNGF